MISAPRASPIHVAASDRIPAEHPPLVATPQLVRNGALITISRLIAAVTVAVSVPVLLGHLGPQGYGILESILAVSTSIMILQTAVSGTVLWRVSGCCGSEDRAAAKHVVQLGITVSLLLLITCLPPLCVFRFQILRHLQLPPDQLAAAGWLIPGVVAIVILGGINQAQLAVLSGFQRAGIAAMIHSSGLIVTQVVIMIGVMCGGGLPSLVWGTLTGFVATFVLAYPRARSCCGRICLLPALPTREDVRVLAPYAGLLLISNLSVILRDQADKVVLAALAAPAMAGYFSIAQRLAGLVMQACAVLFVPMTAAFGALCARNDLTNVRRSYAKWSTWMAALSGMAGFAVITLRSPLLVVWLGEDRPEAHLFVGLLLLATVSAIILSGPGVALAKGIGRPGLETRYALITLLVVLLTKPAMVAVWGPVAGVVSSAGGWIVGAVLFLVMLHRQVPLGSLARQRLLGIWCVTLVAAAAGWWIGMSPLLQPLNRPRAILSLLIAVPLLGFAYTSILVLLRLIDGLPFLRGAGSMATAGNEVYEKPIPGISG
jgi:O-antigen/teichoic acid export membrane protein